MGTLDRRSLNRATLARQLLLDRSELPVLAAVEHLVGLQAQTPHTWYVGLWSRLRELDPVAVGAMLTDRRLVRIAVMRSTIHLVSARDAQGLRPLLQQVSTKGFHGNWGKKLPGVDLDAVVAAGRLLIEKQPLSFTELGKELGRQWPDADEASLAQTIRAFLALVQVPPRGVWGRSGLARHTTVESWLGSPPAELPSPAGMLLRYLAAFGPASVKDMQTWSGLTRLAEVIEPLRATLITFRDEQGVELFDLPDAPRPEPDVPAPPRLLYDFDNLLLSHADRTRVLTPEAVITQKADPYGPIPRFFLIDGFTAGTWTHTEVKGAATLTLRPFDRLSTQDSAALEREAVDLLAFLSSGAATAEVAVIAAETPAHPR